MERKEFLGVSRVSGGSLPLAEELRGAEGTASRFFVTLLAIRDGEPP